MRKDMPWHVEVGFLQYGQRFILVWLRLALWKLSQERSSLKKSPIGDQFRNLGEFIVVIFHCRVSLHHLVNSSKSVLIPIYGENKKRAKKQNEQNSRLFV